MTTPFLTINGLTRSFGPRIALNNITMTLEEGSRTALLGPNGAGKSTLLKIIGGTLRPDAGRVTVGGLDPAQARITPGFLGWLPERAPLNPDLTVLEHLYLGAGLLKLSAKETQDQVELLTESLNLRAKLHRLTGQLSLGTRRQAALAVALLGTPRLLLLDEPTSSLDPDEVRRLRDLLNRLPLTTTLLISSHVIEEVAKVTQEAVLLNQGRKVTQKTWTQLGSEDLEQSYLKEIENHASL
jgi:ABC-2 type transport system ATP-binding protein